MNQLIAYFKSIGVSENDLSEIIEAFRFKKIAKGDYFTKEGKTCKYLAYITKGLFQYYYLKDGKEITTYVSREFSFLTSVYSFYKQLPGKEFVRALVDSEIWQIHYDDLTILKTKNESFKLFYINAIEQTLAGIDESRSKLITLSGEERYASMMKEEPELLQQIPLQYLASILGVTPRHLSRIRNNYT